MNRFLATLLICLAASAARAADPPPIMITDPKVKTFRAAIQRFFSKGEFGGNELAAAVATVREHGADAAWLTDHCGLDAAAGADVVAGLAGEFLRAADQAGAAGVVDLAEVAYLAGAHLVQHKCVCRRWTSVPYSQSAAAGAPAPPPPAPGWPMRARPSARPIASHTRPGARPCGCRSGPAAGPRCASGSG